MALHIALWICRNIFEVWGLQVRILNVNEETNLDSKTLTPERRDQLLKALLNENRMGTCRESRDSRWCVMEEVRAVQ